MASVAGMPMAMATPSATTAITIGGITGSVPSPGTLDPSLIIRPGGGSDEKIRWMQPPEKQRALAAAVSIASELGLAVDDAIVLHDSNKLTARLLPGDIVARIAPLAHQVARFEIEIAQRLAETQSPAAALDLRADPRVYERDGFAVTLWTYYEPAEPGDVSPADYADALERLHAGMRKLDVR